MADVVLRAEGLVRTYRGGVAPVFALRGVDLTVQRGTFVALRGRSGSGKTTLLNLLGGLDSPDAGQVWVDDVALAGLTDEALTALRRHRLGFVFQAFALLPACSAFENVEVALRLAGYPARQRRARVMEVLSLVGLADKARHRPYELSGGEQQRVGIARALANCPAIILADEPTGELDSNTSRDIVDLFRHLSQAEGVTLIVATHDLTVAERADVTYHIVDGRLYREQ